MHYTRKMLEVDLGKYKKKVADQQKEIQKLKETIAGYEDGQDGVFAMITAVVEQVGEVTISREGISEILEEGRHTIVEYDAETGTYKLRKMGGETDGGEGSPC